MKSPFTNGEVRLEKKATQLEYRKEKFHVMYHYYVCVDTHEHFTDDAIDTLNLTQVHNQYRAKYGIPFVDEIRELRHQYGLSAVKMSEVFGFGPNMYRLYEAGEMPAVANGRMIKLAEDPDEFRRLIHLNKHALEEHEYNKVVKKMENFREQWSKGTAYYEQKLIGCHHPNIYNGFRMPRLKKIAAMVNFFAFHNKPFQTALNKLMFYADFAHYKQHGYAISGTCYQAYERGPVPENYLAIYNYVVHKGYAEVFEIEFPEYVGEQFSADQLQFKEEDALFTETEMAMLKKVSETFKKCTTRQIVDISHREKGWQHNVNDKNHINFMYSFELKHL
jgi:uncharacterized phage-associated protein